MATGDPGGEMAGEPAGGPTGADLHEEAFVRLATLRDGSLLAVRPVEPADRPLLLEGFAHLSERSKFTRFFGPAHRLTQRELSYFTELDGHDHFAWGAFVRRPGESAWVPAAVIRYIRLHDDPACAEIAVTVIDDLQNLGVGTWLVLALDPVARDNGITSFEAFVLAENRSMRTVFHRFGAHETLAEPGVTRFELGLPLVAADPTLEPATVAQLVAAARATSD